MSSGFENATEYGNLRPFDGQATPQTSGLIWEQACNGASATADGVLERTKFHSVCRRRQKTVQDTRWNKFSWPSLSYENLHDCNFSLTFAIKRYLAVHHPRFISLALGDVWSRCRPNACQVLFFVYFKRKTADHWIGLLGGLAWTACMHFTEGSVFGELPSSILQRLTMRCHSKCHRVNG